MNTDMTASDAQDCPACLGEGKTYNENYDDCPACNGTGRAAPLPPPVAEGLEDWIALNFGGRGRALREKYDPPLEGEPWMSMAEAKELTRQAVAKFAAPPVAQAEWLMRKPDDIVERLRNRAKYLRSLQARGINIAYYDADDAETDDEAAGLIEAQAAEIASLTEARDRAAEDMRERAVNKINEWSSVGALLLACGEMTAQEMRTATAIVEALASRVAALHEGKI